MSSSTLVESAKKAAAYQAVAEHLDATTCRYIGIGSGSTVVYVTEAIAAKGVEFYKNMVFIPTGSQSKGLIRDAGLAVCQLPERPIGADGRPVTLDVAFDGADEVDEELNCIKGGGACLLQEKGVAIRAKKFIVVADYRKISPRLCTTWKAGVPIEVSPFFAVDIIEDLKEMGSVNPTIRSGLPAKAGECVTDNGNWIIDAPFEPLLLTKDGEKPGCWEVGALAAALKNLEGVIETGLFHGINGIQAEKQGKKRAQKPVAAYFGMQDGSVSVQKA
ncbi:ribose-5-phosphate isomerase rki1 [Ceratocystis pirilliformis]|uniref:Ribose-5-phosphate isomerase n=1 Tax=Ceratocystis pirilliformis TaxID=259994 RepID=A0ABR3ZGR7_9PEZI